MRVLPLISRLSSLIYASAIIIRTMQIKVNGDAREMPDGTTLRTLLANFKMVPEKVAIELNRRLARADKYDLPLKDGDEVEIVTFVGGG